MMQPTNPYAIAIMNNKNIFDKLTTMQKQFDSITKQKCSTNSTCSTNNTNPIQCTNISVYYWLHGACAHSSQECHNKRYGHKDNATFENKMVGITYYCPPTTTNNDT